MVIPATLASIQEIPAAFWAAPAGGVLALAAAWVFASSVMSRAEGEPEMIRIAQAVRDGAMAYLSRQYRVVAVVFLVIIAVLGVLSMGLGLQPALSMIGVPVAGFLSGLCGWLGMRIATNASARTAFAAKTSLNDGLTVALRSGAVMGLSVVGFALLDVSAWFVILNSGVVPGVSGPAVITTVMLSFAMGASTQALFARVGGGIFTKAADVGADLVGKVEAGIPEDDPRNPAVIADNVGDNVGDVAGMGADLYESYYGSLLSTFALGAAAAATIPAISAGESVGLAMRLIAVPAAIAGLGIACSIVGILSVRTSEGTSFAGLLSALTRGVWIAAGLIAIGAMGVLYWLLREVPEVSWLGLWGSIMSGLLAGLIIARSTEYYTSYEHTPTRRIAVQARTGSATLIIAGISEGMRSTWAALATIVAGILAAFVLGGGGDNILLGLYGVAIAAVGMLSTLGITLATDAYGPIADNAGGNAEMSGQPPEVRQRTDMLDSLGNTTAATGKGFAIGSAALTALALLAAYVQVVQTQLTSQALDFARANESTLRLAEKAPCAVFMGYQKFALVLPGAGSGGGPVYDGALLFDPQSLGHLYPQLRVGQVFQLESAVAGENHNHDHDHGHDDDGEDSAHRGRGAIRVHHSQQHGDHVDSVEFDLVRTSEVDLHSVMTFYGVTLINPSVLGGLFLGVMLTFLFCAMTMSAVGRAAYAMMGECRRQFGIIRRVLRDDGMGEGDVMDPANWPRSIELNGDRYPDYATCVRISTRGAQREMVVPALIAILAPIATGVVLSVPGVVGLLAGGLTAGFAVAVFMANAGGAWDNAKKLIESYGKISADEFLRSSDVRERIPPEIREQLVAKATELQRTGRGGEVVYGKGSDDHKAAVVGDTVGDPFKDTSGPSLNILIKLISIVSVVFAGLTVKFGPAVGDWLGITGGGGAH
ncbi:MAG: sodium/proton-translocating pyrophosphatase [Phycisphaeraceae bacterium]|nr:sodium/proton-translocating pyrophosphatase [Phycisphaeraceae bacterium]